MLNTYYYACHKYDLIEKLLSLNLWKHTYIPCSNLLSNWVLVANKEDGNDKFSFY